MVFKEYKQNDLFRFANNLWFEHDWIEFLFRLG